MTNSFSLMKISLKHCFGSSLNKQTHSKTYMSYSYRRCLKNDHYRRNMILFVNLNTCKCPRRINSLPGSGLYWRMGCSSSWRMIVSCDISKLETVLLVLFFGSPISSKQRHVLLNQESNSTYRLRDRFFLWTNTNWIAFSKQKCCYLWMLWSGCWVYRTVQWDSVWYLSHCL
jgi:hypothetical protein